ncbi:MAG: YceI family protein [Fibrobacteria bacterium]|jgi:polyisoprenoid-binding protein YceI|nr:YceI family protein [Fibrobacteria bacterium]
MSTRLREILTSGIFAFGGGLICAGVPAQAKVHAALKDESTLSYTLIHKMHEITGVSKNFKCRVELETDTTKTRIHVKGAVAGFNSGNSTRDANVLEVLEATKYPHVEFLGDSVRREGKDWRVFGRLTFHGVKRSLNFKVSPQVSGNKVRIQGGFKVSLTEFKIERPRLLLIPVEDDLEIRIDVVAKVE